MLSVLRGIDRLVVGAALGTAMALLALMACITFYQVITRFVFETPSTWSEVTARALMVWMVYLGLAACLRAGTLISVDMLMNAVGPRTRKALAVCIAAVSLGVLAVMFWYGWAMAERTATQSLAGLTDPITGANVSIGLVYAAIPVGAALAIVATVARLAEVLAGAAEPRAGPATPDI
ncbi:MAG: TRAP transporter small permease [Rhodobacteraceae bacterium]|nr:TRAP transporter small permease [Paracoccaceae bacterium]